MTNCITRRIIIAGSRDFNDYDLLKRILKEEIGEDEVEIVCGEAKGADLLGRRFAEENNIQIKSFPPQWSRYGRGAGMVRNTQMAMYANELIAFWDGQSRGTKNMIQTAKENELKVRVERY